MIRIPLLTLLLSLMLGSHAVQAAGPSGVKPMPFADQPTVFASGERAVPSTRMPMQMVMAQLEASTGGRVVGAKQVIDRNGDAVYEVKLLMPNGVVKVMRVDPESGAPR